MKSDVPQTFPRVAPFHVMTKPVGPICNLDCTYCFYLEKEKLFPSTEKFRLSDELLAARVGQCPCRGGGSASWWCG